MPLKEIDVLKAKSEQTYLIGHGERISMDPNLATSQGVEEGQQVRIIRKDNDSKYAMYTVFALMEDGNDNDDVRMALDGRERLDMSDAFDAYLDPNGPRTDLTESECQNNNEYGEFLDETTSVHTKLVACAPHGGVIENYTDEQAERVYSQLSGQSKDVSCWRCKGWHSVLGAYTAWHITSTEISKDAFLLLDQISDREFEFAVAFHGYSEDDIAIGGSAPLALKNEIKAAIEAIPNFPYDVTVVTSGDYSGTSPDNFVNWLTENGEGGVQIEQPYGARQTYGQAIADAVASVFASKI